jgi:hypothetical protein
MHLYFTVPLERLGHEVEVFDHHATGRKHGRTGATERLVAKIVRGEFDVVLYQTTGDEPIDMDALGPLARRFVIVAWNSDDDWQFDKTSRNARNVTFMATTYPQIYDAHRHRFGNLILSQWGCCSLYSEFERTKDIGFSFAGAVYGNRNALCRTLKRRAGLECYGRGARLVSLGLPYFRGAFKVPVVSGDAMDFRGINGVWNRSKVSLTPLSAGGKAHSLQIKSRVFDMGLSGTMMLCDDAPYLERYYVPGKECVVYTSVEECIDKARYFLSHESERRTIATAFYARTMREHLWEHRFVRLFSDMGVTCAR